MNRANRRTRFHHLGLRVVWDAQCRPVATLNANPDSSRNRLEVSPRWNCQALCQVPALYIGASSASIAWP